LPSEARRRGGKPAPDKRPDKKGGSAPRTGKPIWLIALGLLLLGWGGGYGISTLFLFPEPPPLGDLFEVPDLGGLGLASARERLLGAGLQLGEIDSLLHPSVAQSLIIGQSPLAGQVARPEAPVRVTLSRGPQMRSIPDVARLQESGARIVLESSGFMVSMDTAQAEVPRGFVIETRPTAASVLALPSEVRMIVSTGPPVVPMPLVLGLGEDEAFQMLDSLGLVVVEVVEVFRFGRDQGIVVEQEPAVDTELERGAEVRLSVGRRGRLREH
jgi:eukaryotic-like serine/threonine-protein kinase